LNKTLEAENISKVIKNKVILNNINLNSYASEVLAILGPNGSGKSTLFKIIVSQVFPTAGKIKLFNTEIRNRRIFEYVGALIETPLFYDYLTGYQNLKMFTKHTKSIVDLANDFALENDLNKKVKKYSLGMKQKLALIKAFLDEPKLILLDEPTNGLDVEGVKVLREKINLFKNRGATIIIASHILSEVELIYDRVVMLNKGSLILNISAGQNSKKYKYLTNDKSKLLELIQKMNIAHQIEEPYISIFLEGYQQIGKFNKIIFQNEIEIHEIIPEKISLEDIYFENLGS
jgi:ABC-type multidrug transport system ATPase subunit